MIGAMVCLLAAPWVQLFVSAGNRWPHNALRHHWLMPIGCHFRDCKALQVTSLTHVSDAIASVQTFTFTFTFYLFVIGNIAFLSCWSAASETDVGIQPVLLLCVDTFSVYCCWQHYCTISDKPDLKKDSP